MESGVTMPAPDSTSLSGVLAAIRKAARNESLSVQDVFTEIGDRSFATALLIPALILVSPISGIPGAPTIGAFIVILVVVQWLVGRDHLWLPGFIMKRRVRSDRMQKALTWFDRPAAFIDRHCAPRLTFFASGPFALVALLTVLSIAATWPLLELLPFVTTIGAFAVSLFAFGLMTKDGAYVILGYAFVGGLAAMLAGII